MHDLPFLRHLNDAQHEAVTCPEGSALILAGAGSGKTRVLTSRIAWLLHAGHAHPNQILAVTFTNKAAKEMIARISAMLPFAPERSWIGTFHGLCNKMLRIHAKEAGLSSTFQIMDTADQLAMIKRLLKAANLPEERYRPSQVAQFINGQKEQGLRASDVSDDNPWVHDAMTIYAAYETQCQSDNLVDFAELLLRSFELLQKNEPIRNHYQQRFTHILVDEFQDTNRLQYRWLKLLAGDRNTLFAVGDDDQSIYSFRGATTTNMQHFERDFQVKNLIRLEQNYRSFGHILDAANAVISYNGARLGKNLWTDAGSGDPILCYEAQSDLSEARWIANRLESHLFRGTPASEIAILYRTNALSRVLEHALFSAGIAYRVYGGLRFFDRMEIKHAMAYLRLIANHADDQAFLRIVNFPPRGIGAKSVERQQEIAALQGISLFHTISQSSGRGATSLIQFGQFIASMGQKARQLPLEELVSVVIHDTGLIDYYRNEKEGTDRIENLQELVSAARLFAEEYVEDENEGVSVLDGFLTHTSLEAGEFQNQDTQQSAVQLMTIHAAKGLEFDVVFLAGCEEGILPHENSLAQTSSLEEERRLMYVAITRAKRQLYLSCSRSRMLHGQTRYLLRSRFIDEIPETTITFEQESDYDRPIQKSNGQQFNRPTSATTSKKTVQGFFIGQLVTHAKFGEGTITAIEGQAADARVEVRFKKAGTKWLALEYAKLTPAGSS